MATLPYQKTDVVDNSAYQSSLVADTGINIASIINADTGPMDRVTLQSSADLIKYFCTGSAITAKSDQTIQVLGAMLATGGVDVIRVGTANIKIGRTDDGQLVFTDSNYNVIPKLSRLKFTSVEENPTLLCLRIGNIVYYVADSQSHKPDTQYETQYIEGDVTVENLIRGVSDKCIAVGEDYIITEQNNVACDGGELDTISIETTYVSTNKTLYPIENSLIPIDSYITIDNVSYYFIGDGTQFSQDNITKLSENGGVVIRIKNSLNNIRTERFIAKVISEAFINNTNTFIESDVKFDFSHVIEYSKGENDDYGYTNTYDFSTRLSDLGIYTYSHNDEITSGYFTIDNFPDTTSPTGYTTRRFAWNLPDNTFIKEGDNNDSIHTYSITTESTDFIQILQEFELEYTKTIDTLIPVYTEQSNELTTPSMYFENSTVSIATLNEYAKLEDVEEAGVYKTYVHLKEVEDNELSVQVDGVVYYIGEDPSDKYSNVTSSVRLGNSPMTVSDFKVKLFNQLNADLIMGKINNDSIWVSGDVNVTSKSIIIITKAIKNQDIDLETSKFALVAKFPSSKKLFDYAYMKDTSIEDFDVLKISYVYNQIQGTMVISFDANAVDGYGNALYYDRYNDGENETSLFKIIEVNPDNETPQNVDSITVEPWGNEILMAEPTLADYQAAMLKYLDYEDKQYRYIWDSGYSMPAFAKTMFTVATEKNAQVVLSYPVTYKAGDEENVLNYYTAIGVDSPRMYHIVPAHKSTYNGGFLTTVPASVSFLAARINSYKNVTPELQPLFGANRGATSAPNLVWRINKTTQQKFADSQINCIVNDINGTYINFNMTGQKKTTYLSEEQNMYISDVIAGVCEQFNPTIIAEQNNEELWETVERTVTSMVTQRVMVNKNPAPAGIRVRCVEFMKANPDIAESRQVKYWVDVKYYPTACYINATVQVVRLNAF